MEPEERKMLEQLLHISQQNNRILRRMRREVLFSRFIHLFYWIAILVIGFVGYYYLKPYIEQATASIQSGNINPSNIIPNMPK